MKELTKLETRVMRDILSNGFNTPLSRLAEKLRIKPGTLSYVMRKLEQNGVILGYRYRLNPLALGFPLPVWFFLKVRDKRKVEDIKKRLFDYNEFYTIMDVTGETDLALLGFFKSAFDINPFVAGLSTEFGRELKGFYTFPVISIEKFHHIPIRVKRPVSIDAKTKRILDFIVKNPISSVSRIARETGFHRNTVARRLAYLWEKQIILKRTIILNQEYSPVLGINFRALMFLNIDPENRNKTISELRDQEFIHELFMLASNFDALAIVRSASMQDLYRDMLSLYNKNIIMDTETKVVFRFIERTLPFLNQLN